MKTLTVNRLILVAIAGLSLAVGPGCGKKYSFSKGTALSQQPTSPPPGGGNPGGGDQDPPVCDPNDPGNGMPGVYGLKGSLYLPADQNGNDDEESRTLISSPSNRWTPPYRSVVPFINQGRLMGPVQMDDVNVSTLLFDAPFPLANNNFVTDENGEVRKEWFALSLESDLGLIDTDSEGYYQFGVLSDDGAILRKQNASEEGGEMLVQNDGAHHTKFACSEKAIFLRQGDKLPIRLTYFQGGGTKALMLLWRRVDQANPGKHGGMCGESGNEKFFDPNYTPSKAKEGFNQMLEDGWKVLQHKNYILQDPIPGSGGGSCEEPGGGIGV